MDGLPHENPQAPNGLFFGEDGSPGKQGLQGENGGNVNVCCTKLHNSSSWIVFCEGGRGGPGQHGGNGHDGSDGQDAIPPGWHSLDTFQDPKRAALADCQDILASGIHNETLEERFQALKQKINSLPGGVDFDSECKLEDERFYLKGNRKSDGGKIIACGREHRVRVFLKQRHELIYLQGTLGAEGQRGGLAGEGGKGGQGGIHGSFSVLTSRYLHPTVSDTRAPDGPSGMNGKPGRNGENGNRYPDAALISKSFPSKLMDTLIARFCPSSNEALDIIFTSEKPATESNQKDYVRCADSADGKKRYATIHFLGPSNAAIKHDASCQASLTQKNTTQNAAAITTHFNEAFKLQVSMSLSSAGLRTRLRSKLEIDGRDAKHLAESWLHRWPADDSSVIWKKQSNCRCISREHLRVKAQGFDEGENEEDKSLSRWLSLLHRKYDMPEELLRLVRIQLNHMAMAHSVPQENVILFICRAVDWVHDNNRSSKLMEIAAETCPHVWPHRLLVADTALTLLSLQNVVSLSNYKSLITSLNSIEVNVLKMVHESSSRALANYCKSPRYGLTNYEIATTLVLLRGRQNEVEWDDNEIHHLSQTEFYKWLPYLVWTYWRKRLNKINVGESKREEILYLLLELEKKRGHSWIYREFDDICFEMNHGWTKVNILTKLKDHLWLTYGSMFYKEKTLNEILKHTTVYCGAGLALGYFDRKSIVGFIEKSKRNVSTGTREEMEKAVREWSVSTANNKSDVAEFLRHFDMAVQVCKNFRLRDNQRLAIVCVITRQIFDSEKDPLCDGIIEMGTGEGKSLIIAAAAAYFALNGRFVDVVTVNSTLAKRDSRLGSERGGVRDLYELFNITVANNCTTAEEERRQAYRAMVVYGDISGFQRDYLDDSLFNRSLRGDRTYDVVIIDEVDSILLDHGNRSLYLSHDIPGIQTLEAIYIFIWAGINSETEPDVLKSKILFDLFGAIKKEDLTDVVKSKKTISCARNQMKSIVEDLWFQLVAIGVIDSDGKSLLEESEDLEERFRPLQGNTTYKIPRLIHYFRKVANRQRLFNIPTFLLPFVERNLDEWMSNAKTALLLERDVDYVVDEDRTKSSPSLFPIITIIDPGSGTDQSNCQWDAGLHQFVQIKECGQVTLQAQHAIFVSNRTYVLQYKRYIGFSGTIGTEREQFSMSVAINRPSNTLTGTSTVGYSIAIPPALNKASTVLTPTMCCTETEWLNAIYEKTADMIHQECPRSVLIMCESIRDANLVYRRFALSPVKSSQLWLYRREHEAFIFDEKELDVSHVIVATCLASRGTNIKLSGQLRANGGLHVCIAFVPNNLRIEQQIIGRAGRNGAPGSYEFIVQDTNELVWPDSANLKDPWSRIALAKLYKTHVTRLETTARSKVEKHVAMRDTHLLNLFQNFFVEFRKKCHQKCHATETDVYCGSLQDEFALWLNAIRHEDSISLGEKPASLKGKNFAHRLNIEFLPKYKAFHEDKSPTLCPDWVTPARRVQLAKFWISSGEESKMKEAKKILDDLVQARDVVCHPSAHYYSAYLIARSGKVKEQTPQFLQHLRSAKKIISEQIQEQLSFVSIRALHWESKYGGDGESMKQLENSPYVTQKRNVVCLLENQLANISRMLGNWLKPEQLSCLGEKVVEEEQQQLIWQALVRNKFVLQYRAIHLNGKSPTLRLLSFKYGIDQSELLKLLSTCNDLPEESLLQKIEESHLFNGRSREAFWKHLESKFVLRKPEDCLVISKEEWGKLGKPGTPIENSSRCLFRDPSFLKYSRLQNNSDYVVLKKSSVEYLESYRKNRRKFNINKLATGIHLDRLEFVTGSVFKREDFRRLYIPDEDWNDLFESLVYQNIIDNDGHPRNIEAIFRHPECPYYEEDVNRVIYHVFTEEKVLRGWKICIGDDPGNLSEEAATQMNNFLDILPLHPGRTLISDLIFMGIIIPPCVTDDDSIEFDRDGSGIDKFLHLLKPASLQGECKTNEFRVLLKKFLKENRASYVGLKTSKAILKSLTEELISSQPLACLDEKSFAYETTTGLYSELYILRLNAFDDLFSFEEGSLLGNVPRWSVAALFIGVIRMSVGLVRAIPSVALLRPSPACIMFLDGMSDIGYFVRRLTNKQLTQADYLKAKAGSRTYFSALRNLYDICFGSLPSSEFQGFVKGPNTRRDVDRTNISFGYAGKVTKVAANFLEEVSSRTTDDKAVEYQVIVNQPSGTSRPPQQSPVNLGSRIKLSTHVDTCIRLMEKTNNPEILVLIFKNTTIPAHRLIVDALAYLLPTALEFFGITVHEVDIKIKLSSTGESFYQVKFNHELSNATSKMYVVAADRVTVNQDQFVEAYAPFKGCNELVCQAEEIASFECLIDCLAWQINEAHLHELKKRVDGEKLCAVLASTVSNSSLISLIKEAWGKYPKNQRFPAFRGIAC